MILPQVKYDYENNILWADIYAIEPAAITAKNHTVEQMEVVQKVDVYVQNILKAVSTVHFASTLGS